MNHELKKRLYEYFSAKENPTQEEVDFRNELFDELQFFQVTSVSRDDLKEYGYNVENTSDELMIDLVSKMEERFIPNSFWDDLDNLATELGLIKNKNEHFCPRCLSFDISIYISSQYTCNGCDQQWGEDYVLAEDPDDVKYFRESEIGYPSSECQGCGQYVTEFEFVHYKKEDPPKNSYYRPVCWPDSQLYMAEDPEDENSIDALNELINDQKGLDDFGSAAYWVPLCNI